MKILLHTNAVQLTDLERELVISRLGEELGHLAGIVNRVNVYFQDVNGPKGGCDKSCRLVIHMRRRPPVVIQDEDAELDPLLYRLLDRLGETLQRRNTSRRGRASAGSLAHE